MAALRNSPQDGSPLKFSLPSSSPPQAIQERNGGKKLMTGLSQQISLSYCTCRESCSMSQGRCHWHSFSGLGGRFPSGKYTCSCLKYPGKGLKEYEQSPKHNRNSNQKNSNKEISNEGAVGIGLVQVSDANCINWRLRPKMLNTDMTQLLMG